MDWSLFIDLFTNADRFLITIANDYGILIYIIMFMIFFLETGIVVMAFLPGDSLLFVAGAVTATGAIDPWWLTGVVTLGAILGNTSNFYIGSWLGHKIYDGSISWIDQEALNKTHQFYLLHLVAAQLQMILQMTQIQTKTLQKPKFFQIKSFKKMSTKC